MNELFTALILHSVTTVKIDAGTQDKANTAPMHSIYLYMVNNPCQRC